MYIINMIESLNSQFRAYIKKKSLFPATDISLLK